MSRPESMDALRRAQKAQQEHDKRVPVQLSLSREGAKAEEMRLRLEGERSAYEALSSLPLLTMSAEEILKVVVRRHYVVQENLTQLRHDPEGTIREWGL